jgi:uncharacterized integral membrane protein
MLALFIAVVFGLAVGYFATQNITPVTIRLAEYAIEEVPLYVVIVGSMLIGLLIAWILYIARSVSSTITIYGKDSEVKKARQAAADLEHRVQELEAENARLKTKSASPVDEPTS